MKTHRPRVDGARLRPRAQAGFTLIELLVVILIIGVLAAVAIPSFLSQKAKAVDTNAKALVRTAQTAEETYFTDSQAYTNGTSSLVTIESTLGAVASLAAHAPNSNPLGAATPGGVPAETAVNSFDVSVASATGTVYAIVKHSDGTVEHTCFVPLATAASACHLAGGATSGNGVW